MFQSLSFSDRKINRNASFLKGPAQVFPANEVMNSLHYDLEQRQESSLQEDVKEISGDMPAF